ncbi:hypothetical protein V8E36_003563 [Tilletia maclaganii]
MSVQSADDTVATTASTSGRDEHAPLLSSTSARSSSSQHADQHQDEDEDDEEEDIESGQHQQQQQQPAGGVPFPHQPSAARRFRPKHYRTRRNISKLHAWIDRNTGFLLLALAQLFYATMALFFKILNDLPAPSDQGGTISALQVIVVRMFVTAAGCYIYLVFIAKDPHPFLGPPAVRKLLVIRGFSGFFGLFGLYFSLQYLDLADATVLTFLSPLATALLAAPLLKEPLQSRQLVAGLVCIVGVALIARPQFLFGHHGPDGDFDDLPVPGGDEGGGIGTGQQLAQTAEVSASAAVDTIIAAAAAAAPPIAGPIGKVVGTAATATQSFWLNAASLRGMALSFPTATLVAAVPKSRPAATSSVIISSAAAAAAAAAVAAAATGSVLPSPTPHTRTIVTEEQRVLAVAVALLGVIGSAGAYTTLRCIGTRASPTHSVAYFSTWSMLVAGTGMIINRTPFIIPTDVRWAILMVVIGFCGLAAQILAAMGLAREKAGRATVAVYLQAPITVLYQLLLLRTPLEPLSALGSGIILLASIWVTIAKS